MNTAWMRGWKENGEFVVAMVDAKTPDIIRVGPVCSPNPLAACADLLSMCCHRCGANKRVDKERFCTGCRATVIRQLHASGKCRPSWGGFYVRPQNAPGRYGCDGAAWENAVALLEDGEDCEGFGSWFEGSGNGEEA